MILNTLFLIIIVILILLLADSRRDIVKASREAEDLVALRDAALDISNQILHTDYSDSHYKYILHTCMKLIPKAKFGSILMFDEDGLLRAKASVGFDESEISKFRLSVEESFLYLASDGKMDRTLIINRLEELVLEKNIVTATDKDNFPLRSEVASPLFIDDRMVGMLCIDGDKSDIFKNEDIYILEYMSKQISSTINRQTLYQEVLNLSKNDTMTGLMNRNCFDKLSYDYIGTGISMGKDVYFIIMDLDGLKIINDNYGHKSGDRLISYFAEGLYEVLGDHNLVARYGGDEFVALTSNLNMAEIETLLNKLSERFKQSPILIDRQRFHPKFSYGIAKLDDSSSFDDAYRKSDQLMYEQKKNKKTGLKANAVT